MRAQALRLHDDLVLISSLSERAEFFSGLPPKGNPRPKLSRRAKILDALALVGVTAEKEVIAVAVALPNHTNSNTTLFIASNDENIPIATQQFYHSLHGLIKQLVTLHAPLGELPLKNEDNKTVQIEGMCFSLCVLEPKATANQLATTGCCRSFDPKPRHRCPMAATSISKVNPSFLRNEAR